MKLRKETDLAGRDVYVASGKMVLEFGISPSGLSLSALAIDDRLSSDAAGPLFLSLTRSVLRAGSRSIRQVTRNSCHRRRDVHDIRSNISPIFTL